MFSSLVLFSAAAVAVAQAPTPPCSQYDPTKKLETPCNFELKNSTYQIRIYNVGAGQQSFSTARVQASDWSAATSQGFQANFVRSPLSLSFSLPPLSLTPPPLFLTLNTFSSSRPTLRAPTQTRKRSP